jgi:hypothetical protein
MQLVPSAEVEAVIGEARRHKNLAEKSPMAVDYIDKS